MVEYLPGVAQPVPDLMTASEASRYLRLDILTKPDGTDEPREMADAIKSLDHLVRRGLIRPCRAGKNRRFARAELNRFIEEQTECYSAKA